MRVKRDTAFVSPAVRHVFKLALYAWQVSVCVSLRLYMSALYVHIRM